MKQQGSATAPARGGASAKRSVGMALTLAVLTVGIAGAGVVAGPVSWLGHDYYVLSPQTWEDAEAEAVALGGHLATIGDSAEQAFVQSLASSYTAAPWIGFTDLAVEGTWVWTSGEAVTYTNWSLYEPNNAGGIEHCAVIELAWDGLWNDLPCTRSQAAVAEAGSPALSCVGFEPPLADGPVRVRRKGALPFKAQLVDDGNVVTDLDIAAAPVIQVWYEYGTPEAEDVSDEVLPVGNSTEGNEFFFDGTQRWHYHLNTRQYSAAGTYTVFMASGDASEYLVDPTCTGQFVVR